MAHAFTSDNFQDEVLDSDIPVLVDFFAVWCGPCQMMAPILDKIAEEYEGKLKVGKVDVDQNGDIAAQYGIQGIPALKIYKEGKIIAEFTGAMDYATFKGKIDAVI